MKNHVPLQEFTFSILRTWDHFTKFIHQLGTVNTCDRSRSKVLKPDVTL